MTLCIAEKVGQMMFLASDSRIMVTDDRYSDYAIKVLPLDVRISSPKDSVTGKTTVLYSSSFGFAFAGGFEALNAIKDFLSIALQRLQFLPTSGPLTFESICNFAMDLYNHVSLKLLHELKDGDVIDFFLCGTCPADNIVRLAQFSIAYGSSLDGFEPQFHVYEADKDFPIAIGSGEERFREEYDKLSAIPRHTRAIVALKNVIDGKEIPSVGGNIQYGESHLCYPFSIKGIVVLELREDGTPRMNHFYLGGIDVVDYVSNERHGLFVSGGFITPFDHILF